MAKKDSTHSSESKQDSKSIFKTPKRRRYVSIANELVQHPDLSLEAIGLMAYVLSLPEDWQIGFIHLQKRAKCGRQKMQHLLRELQAHGYLVRHIRRIAGRFATEWQFHETPVDPSLTGVEIPQRLNRNGQTAAVNQSPYKSNILQTESSYTHTKAGAAHHHQTNDNGGGEMPACGFSDPAQQAFQPVPQHLTPEQQTVLTAIADEIAGACNWDGKRYVFPEDVNVRRTAKALAVRSSWDLTVWRENPELGGALEFLRYSGQVGQAALAQLRQGWGLWRLS